MTGFLVFSSQPFSGQDKTQKILMSFHRDFIFGLFLNTNGTNFITNATIFKNICAYS